MHLPAQRKRDQEEECSRSNKQASQSQGHAPGPHGVSPRVSLIPTCSCKAGVSLCVQPNSLVPDLQAGNPVLIFPFSEATFGASRDG